MRHVKCGLRYVFVREWLKGVTRISIQEIGNVGGFVPLTFEDTVH